LTAEKDRNLDKDTTRDKELVVRVQTRNKD